MTPSDLRRGLALGAGNWAAFQADATDEEKAPYTGEE
jgi:hypothetical protein